MRRTTDIDPRAAAIDRLVRAGRAALPDPTTIAERHLPSVSVALAAERSRELRSSSRPAGRVPRRRLVVAGAMAAFVAIPSLAFAGVLPDPVQRAASTAAGAVGIAIPSPGDERSNARGTAGGASAEHRRDAGDDPATNARSSSTGSNPAGSAAPSSDAERGHVNGTKPGAPTDGEQRGNRFGQVPAGPDKGQAGQAHGDPARPARPVASKPASAKPATTPAHAKPATPAPHAAAPTTPAPAAPVPATPSTGNGNGTANAGGNGNGHSNGNGR